jgi:type II secretory pathway component GspD/PulD (secretin)
VTSRPSVTTSNNKKAKIASGQQVAVPTSIQSSLNNVNNTNGIVSNSNVQFKDVTLELEVVPLINSEREVALEIVQKVDEISGSTRIDNNDIPTIATRYIQTNVSVPNGGTVVLGGLIKQSDNRTRSGVPYLNRLPIFGPLFSSRSKEKIRTELVILLRPEVIWGPEEAIRSRERSSEFLNIEPDLEATVYPQGTRTKYPPERMLRSSTVEVRRAVEVLPSLKK